MLTYTQDDYRRMKDFEEIYSQSGAYHRASTGFQRWWLEANYRLISKFVDVSETVLDLACGEGMLSEHLVNRCIIGIDSSSAAIRLNRKWHPNRYSSLYVGDMRCLGDLPIPSGWIDVVVCSLSFMYLIPEDLEKCLASLKVISKDGGRIVLTYPNISRFRAPGPTAAEMPYSQLRRILEECGIGNLERHNICPVTSELVVGLSRSRVSFALKPYFRYRSARFQNDDERAYHYLVTGTFE